MRICCQRVNRCGQRACITGRHENSSLPVFDELGDTSNFTRDHWKTGCHFFKNRIGETLTERGMDRELCLAEKGLNVGGLAHEIHEMVDSGGLGTMGQRLEFWSRAQYGDANFAVRLCHGVDEDVISLLRPEVSNCHTAWGLNHGIRWVLRKI